MPVPQGAQARAGSVRTAETVSTRMAVRCRVSYAGRPGFPSVAKETPV